MEHEPKGGRRGCRVGSAVHLRCLGFCMCLHLRNRAASGILVVAVAALVQCVYLYESQSDPTFDMPIVDAQVYHHAGIRLAEGRGLSDGPFWQPPLFPALLGAVYWAFGSGVWPAKAALGMIGVASCVVLWSLGRRLFGDRVGVIAGVMLALNGTFVFFCTQLLPVGLATLLCLIGLRLLIAALDRDRPIDWALFGLTVGLGIVTVPNVGLVLLIGVGCLIARAVRRRSAGPAIGRVAIAIGAATVAIAPVTIRNAALGGEFVLISTNGGINFFIGNNAHADETVAIRPGEYWKRLAREAIDSAARTHAGQSRFFLKRALDWGRQHPLDFLAGLGRKTIRVISAREIPRNVDVYAHREDSALLSVLVWRVGSVGFPLALLTPLAVVGMCIGRSKSHERGTDSRRNGEVLSRRVLMSFVLLYPASVALFFVAARYRLPAVAAMTMFSAVGLCELVRMFDPRREPGGRLFQCTLLLFVSLIAVNLPEFPSSDYVDARAERDMAVAAGYRMEGKPEEAERFARRAIRIDSTYAAARIQLGLVLVERSEDAMAAAEFERAIELDPDTAEARWHLGAIHGRAGRFDEARALFAEALARDPHSPESHVGLADTLVVEGRLGDAVEHYRAAAAVETQSAGVMFRLADALVELGRYEQAIETYRREIRRGDPGPERLNKVAWLLATCPDVRFRDCGEAIAIAEDVCRQTQYRHAIAMDTLAAGYAECGRISDAVKTARRAVELASSQGNTAAAESIGERLRMYEHQLAGLEPNSPSPPP